MTTQSIPLASQDRIDKTAQAVQICFLMALLILFNVYPDKVGAYRTVLDASSFVPLLGAGFYAALPWLNAYWLAALALASALLFFEQWTEELRLAGLALSILGIVVGCRLLSGAPLLVSPGWDGPQHWQVLDPLLGSRVWSLSNLVRLGVGILVRLGVGIWLVTLVIGALRHFARLLPTWLPRKTATTRS